MIINFNARRQKPPFLPSNTLFDSNLLKVDFDLRFYLFTHHYKLGRNFVFNFNVVRNIKYLNMNWVLFSKSVVYLCLYSVQCFHSKTSSGLFCFFSSSEFGRLDCDTNCLDLCCNLAV